TGDLRQKSFYSNYGSGITLLAAPGRFNPAADGRGSERPRAVDLAANAPLSDQNKCVSTRTFVVPTNDPNEPIATCCYVHDTSMAAPHVVGVAALALSRLSQSRHRNHAADDGLVQLTQTHLQTTATPIDCPTAAQLAAYAPFPSANNDAPQTCQGTA